MKRIIMVTVLFLLIVGCGKADEVLTLKTITPAEAKTELDRDSAIILIDVRSEQEYATGHIKNSILIPLDDLENNVGTEIPNKGAKIFVYCQGGVRSKKAGQKLVDLGYTNVYDLGGINSWPYEIE